MILEGWVHNVILVCAIQIDAAGRSLGSFIVQMG